MTTDPRAEAATDGTDVENLRACLEVARTIVKGTQLEVLMANQFTQAFAALAAADTVAWRPISTAPTDGTLVWVYVAAFGDLPAFQTVCAYNHWAGWCCDELREATHWVPLRDRWLPPPLASEKGPGT